MATRRQPHEHDGGHDRQTRRDDGAVAGLEFGFGSDRACESGLHRNRDGNPEARGDSGADPTQSKPGQWPCHDDAFERRISFQRLRWRRRECRSEAIEPTRIGESRRWGGWNGAPTMIPWGLRNLLTLFSMKTCFQRFLSCVGGLTGVALTLLTAPTLSAAEKGKTFASPEDAVAALANAVASTNRTDLHAIFGPEIDALVNPDVVQAENEFSSFAKRFGEANRLVRESATRQTLEIGHEAWPFPVPIVEKDGSWVFDTAAGAEELLNRRIGGNELETIEVLRAYVLAQREYASRDRDHDEVLEFAQNVLSTPGTQDGLYWSPETGGEISPLGPLVAAAQAEGYRKSTGETSGPRPFHGYLFKPLLRQGPHAPGGKYGYVINGNMIGGFAMLAWPVSYEETGIMTFIVNQQGRVYQKDLGPRTAKIAKGIQAYNPGPGWTVSPD